MSDYHAVVRNEGMIDAPWFVYIETRYTGATYSCRFAHRNHAEKIAAAMNKAWESEGRLYSPQYQYA